MTDGQIAFLIYGVTLVVASFFALTRPIISDQAQEYDGFVRILRERKPWKYKLLSSCFLSINLPYYLVRSLHLPPRRTFQLVPGFFQAMMPAFIYLITREYFDSGYALLTAIFVSSYLFIYNPNQGRCGIAQGVLSALVWAFLNGYIYVAVTLSVFLVVSHYGTAYQTLFIFGLTWAFLFVKGDWGIPFTHLSSILLILLGLLWLWHGVFQRLTGNYVSEVIIKTLMFSIPERFPASSKRASLLSMKRQEPVVQLAFGRGLKKLSIPKKIEWAINWIFAGLVATGIILALRAGNPPEPLFILAGASIISILVSIILPFISAQYGTIRVYWTSLIFLAPFIPYGVIAISRFLGYDGKMLLGSLIYTLAITLLGIFHPFWGLKKEQNISDNIR